MTEPSENFPGTPDQEHQWMWWLILASLSSWSYVAVWAANSDELAGFFFGHFAAWVGVFLLIGAVVQRVTYLATRGPSSVPRSYAVAAVVLILLQSWNSRLTTDLGLGAQLAAYGAVLVVVVAITYRLAAVFPHVRPVFGVLTVFLVGVPYLAGLGELWNSVWADPPPSVPASAVNPINDDARDVWVVVLDEYTNSSVLQSDFGFDNSEFEASLGSAGLSVVPYALSNYSNTLLSVAGVLDGRYPAVGEPTDITYASLVGTHSGENRLFASLQRAGYETHLFDNRWTFTRCGPNVNVCHTGGLNELDWLVAGRTPFIDLIPWLQTSPWIRGSLEQLDGATRLAGEPATRPRLVYLHALIPHAPLQLTADCATSLPGLGSLEGVIDSHSARAAYVDQVRCVNRRVLDLIRAIPDDAIVLVTGDHGVRWASTDLGDADLSPAAASRTLGVLTAYRFPPACTPPTSDASVIRTAASLFACLGIESEVAPAYDPSQSDRFFNQTLDRDGTYRVTDITPAVRGARN